MLCFITIGRACEERVVGPFGLSSWEADSKGWDLRHEASPISTAHVLASTHLLLTLCHLHPLSPQPEKSDDSIEAGLQRVAVPPKRQMTICTQTKHLGLRVCSELIWPT